MMWNAKPESIWNYLTTRMGCNYEIQPDLVVTEGQMINIAEQIAEIAREVPEEEWAKVPPDLAENLEHYLYGHPKGEIGDADKS